MTNPDYVERSTAVIGQVEGLELAPHAIRLLSGGEPVALEQLAATAGWSVEAVEAALRAQMSAERDDEGRLVGLGLTLRPTNHRFTVGGRTLFAWCASDALMFPVILGGPGVIESTCPQTGQTIRIELTPDGVERVDPPNAVVSAVRPADLTDVRSSICQHGHFFSSPAAATPWAQEHPDAELYSIEDAFRLDRQVIKQLGWDAPARAH
ncbi:MAG TPA: organomercurial lyase MerB [Solirubrobacteraceae bacterium]|nr:organomercurial lyase MerB [Solirubrobacteraceae bacterium]